MFEGKQIHLRFFVPFQRTFQRRGQQVEHRVNTLHFRQSISIDIGTRRDQKDRINRTDVMHCPNEFFLVGRTDEKDPLRTSVKKFVTGRFVVIDPNAVVDRVKSFDLFGRESRFQIQIDEEKNLAIGGQSGRMFTNRKFIGEMNVWILRTGRCVGQDGFRCHN